MKLILFLTFSLTIKLFYVNGQTFHWAKSVGGTTIDEVNSIDYDASGNLYTTGYFQGTVDFNPNAGVFNLTSIGGIHDCFISKLDLNGNFDWAIRIGSTGYDYGISIDVDAAGNVVLTGKFDGTVDFDPSAASFNLTGIEDLFVAKYSNAGALIWAKSLSNGGYATPTELKTDNANNVFIIGDYSDLVDFDPDAPVATLTVAADESLPFILKLTSAGVFSWVQQPTNPSDVINKGLAIDNAGNVHVTGAYRNNTTDFNTGIGVATFPTTAFSAGAFILKLTNAGAFIWARGLPGTSVYISNSISTDPSGNVYTTGKFTATRDFNPGVAVVNIAAVGITNDEDGFILKLSVNGDFLWARTLQGSDNCEGTYITTDAAGYPYITGPFRGTCDFIFGVGTSNLSAAGNSDSFILKYTANGDLAWVRKVGGSNYEVSNIIRVDQVGNVYTSGNFQGTGNFNTDSGGTLNLTALAGYQDGFVHKINQLTFLPIDLLYFKGDNTESDAVLSWEFASFSNLESLEIERSKDGITFKKIGEFQESSELILNHTYNFVDSRIFENNPLYYYRLKQIDINGDESYSETIAIGSNNKYIPIFILFPNPASSIISIKSEELIDLKIMNSFGQLITNIQLNDLNNFQLTLTNLKTGIYLIQGISNNTITVQKFEVIN